MVYGEAPGSMAAMASGPRLSTMDHNPFLTILATGSPPPSTARTAAASPRRWPSSLSPAIIEKAVATSSSLLPVSKPCCAASLHHAKLASAAGPLPFAPSFFLSIPSTDQPPSSPPIHHGHRRPPSCCRPKATLLPTPVGKPITPFLFSPAASTHPRPISHGRHLPSLFGSPKRSLSPPPPRRWPELTTRQYCRPTAASPCPAITTSPSQPDQRPPQATCTSFQDTAGKPISSSPLSPHLLSCCRPLKLLLLSSFAPPNAHQLDPPIIPIAAGLNHLLHPEKNASHPFHLRHRSLPMAR